MEKRRQNRTIDQFTSVDKSKSFSVDDFPCPLMSIATTRALSLILLADNANESLAKTNLKKNKKK